MTEAGLFTLGVEEEFQIVDPVTRELKSHIQQILEDGKIILKENVKAEMHQSVVEVGTDICRDVKDAREQVTKLRTDLSSGKTDVCLPLQFLIRFSLQVLQDQF